MSNHSAKDDPSSVSDAGSLWKRRSVLQALGATAAGAAIGLPQSLQAADIVNGGSLISLDAEKLAPGALAQWANEGSLGGVFAAGEKSQLKVDTVDGRKAVVFDGKSWLRSSFMLPELIAGNKPFTMMMWFRASRSSHHSTLFTLGSRPKICAEFNNHFGSVYSEAAFNGFGESILGHGDGQPPSGTWHHVAYSYSGGDKGRLRILLNGQLSSEGALTVQSVAGEPCFLGSGFDTKNGQPLVPFAGAIASLTVFGRSLQAWEVRNAIGKFEAFSPSPEDGQILDHGEVVLRWSSGRQGTKAALMIADSEGALAQAKPQPLEKIRAGANAGELEFGPLPVPVGGRVFWRVDQIHANGRDNGQPWKFQISTGPASSPTPRDQITGVSTTLTELAWKPGPYARAQALFFGESAEEVANANQPVAKMDAKASSYQLKQPLKPGQKYFWRVASDNGQLPANPGAVWSFRTADAREKNNITFIIATDQHYGRDDVTHNINHAVVTHINSLAGTPYPKNLGGGFVRTPLGVVAPGDLLHKGYDPKTSMGKWDEWVADFGLTGKEGHLAFPVYEGIGNHDGGPTKSIPRAKIRERNKLRVGLTQISENGLHYSWDWDHVHLVQVNLFPGDTPADATVGPAEHDPEMALDFLKKDLAKYVGDSGKPVIILQHYGVLGGMTDWWTPESKERYYAAIEKYNVIGIFCGHSHGTEFIQWKKFFTAHCGSTARPEYGSGDFMVINVTETEMTVVHRKPDSWGVSRKIPIQTPAAFKA
jgi:hypothetical protein